MFREAFEVQPAVELLFVEYAREAVSQLRIERGPAQQPPGEQLDRHQLVVSEAGQAARSRAGVGEHAGPR